MTARAETLEWTWRRREEQFEGGRYEEADRYDALIPSTAMGDIVYCKKCDCTHLDPVDCQCCSEAQGYTCPNCGDIGFDVGYMDMDPATDAVVRLNECGGRAK